MSPRDTQRQRVYNAELAFRSALGDRLLRGGTRTRDGAPTLEACQDYIDAILKAAWFRRRWGKQTITVTYQPFSYARARGGNGRIKVPPHMRDEATLLHELAHNLTPGRFAAHGPEFCGTYITLLRFVAGTDAARRQRANWKAKRVRYTMQHVPDPDKHSATRTAEAAKKKQRAAQPVDPYYIAQAARTIRRLATQGYFGPAGRKPRAHALETARALEKG